MDLLADKLRGYLGFVDDLFQQPEKVLAACQSLMPHLVHFALATADPLKQVPIGFWMHRGCVPFISFDHFDRIAWPTLRPMVEQLWAHGHQTLFYAEGNWDRHLHSFAELPERSIVYHVDQGDIFKAHEVLGEKFCLSGGIPNFLLGFRTPEEVRSCCKKVINRWSTTRPATPPSPSRRAATASRSTSACPAASCSPSASAKSSSRWVSISRAGRA